MFLSNVWMLNEVISKQESIPMFEVGLNHVDVMRSVPIPVTLDKPSIERWDVISK